MACAWPFVTNVPVTTGTGHSGALRFMTGPDHSQHAYLNNIVLTFFSLQKL
ncbi:hypothetical protein BDZ91DRAFT_748217, partial [Kalaharituber pfeilii]